jgi:hypothetical protein
LTYEIRLLRLGLIMAPDSVCVDAEGEFSAPTNREE